MGNLLLPILTKYWKGIAISAAVAALGAYIAFLHHTINADQDMLDVAHAQMTKLTTEYKADITQMATSITAQNAQIDLLKQQGEQAKADLSIANQNAGKVRQQSDAKVASILAGPIAAGCDNSILDLVQSSKTLIWDTPK